MMTAYVFVEPVRRGSRKVHVLPNFPTNRLRTPCGREVSYGPWRGVEAYAVSSADFCKRCRQSLSAQGIELFPPSPDAVSTVAVSKAATIARDPSRIVRIQAAVYRVRGSTDTYTVTVPLEMDLGSTCTCKAAKIHPDVMCKHQVAVFLANREGVA